VSATPAIKCAVKHQQLHTGLKIEKILLSWLGYSCLSFTWITFQWWLGKLC